LAAFLSGPLFSAVFTSAFLSADFATSDFGGEAGFVFAGWRCAAALLDFCLPSA
jgi:hypothetical protein